MEIVNVIQTVGFPIASWLILAWYIYNQDSREDRKTETWQRCIDNNTNAVTNLTEIIRTFVKKED